MLADRALPKLANMNATAPKQSEIIKHANPAIRILTGGTSRSTIFAIIIAVNTPALDAINVIVMPVKALAKSNLDLEIGRDNNSSIVPSRSSLPIRELPKEIDNIPRSIGSIK